MKNKIIQHLEENDFYTVYDRNKQRTKIPSTLYRKPCFTGRQGDYGIVTGRLDSFGIYSTVNTLVDLDVLVFEDKNDIDFYGLFRCYLTLTFDVEILGKNITLSHSVRLPFKKFSDLKKFTNFIVW
jgi:hypothetical protein